MITSKAELRDVISFEERIYFGPKGLNPEKRFRSNIRTNIFRYLKACRKYEYYSWKRDRTHGILSVFFSQIVKLADRRKNKYSLAVNVEGAEKAGKGLNIYHAGVVLNGKIGEDCIFHGNNVIGNKGVGRRSEIPTVGNGVEFGAGAIAVGKIEIADNCIVAAGAVVTKSFTIPGTIIAGVPAKEIGRIDSVS